MCVIAYFRNSISDNEAFWKCRDLHLGHIVHIPSGRRRNLVDGAYAYSKMCFPSRLCIKWNYPYNQLSVGVKIWILKRILTPNKTKL